MFGLEDIWSASYSILRRHERMLVISTGVLALFTALLAIYTWRLWKDARTRVAFRRCSTAAIL